MNKWDLRSGQRFRIEASKHTGLLPVVLSCLSYGQGMGVTVANTDLDTPSYASKPSLRSDTTDASLASDKHYAKSGQSATTRKRVTNFANWLALSFPNC